MLVYFLLLCYCSGLTLAFSAADDDALLDPSLLEEDSSGDEGPDSGVWQLENEHGLAAIFPPLRKPANASAASTRRIVGGRTTTIRRFPYTVAILRGGDLWCGGAVIHTSWVLTAAHCMKDVYGAHHQRRITSFDVRAGSSHPDRGGVLVKLKRAFFPRQYRPFLANFDYSLLLLRQGLPLGHGIALVRMPPQGSELQPGQLIVVTGWGSTAPSGRGHLPDRMRYVTIPILARKSCQQHYYFPITANMICASYPEGGMDACNHDSGGPATYKDYLVGIVSFGGRLCGDPKSPGVYSRVSKASNWVNSVMKQKSGKDPSRSRNSAPHIPGRIEKRKTKRSRHMRSTKKGGGGSFGSRVSETFIDGPLKKRYQARHNTGVYIKRIGEERKLMEFEPHLRIEAFTEENLGRDEFLSYTEVPIRKGYGRRSNYIDAAFSDNVNLVHNMVKSTSTTKFRTTRTPRILTTGQRNQDGGDSNALAAQTMRRSHRPSIITVGERSGGKQTADATNVTADVWTGDPNERDVTIWKG